MLITLSFDKFASHFCRTLKLRVMNQNSGVGVFHSTVYFLTIILVFVVIFVGQVHNILFITNVCVYVYRNNGGI